MWRQLCRPQLIRQNVRTFLSDAYRCTEAWQSRLNTPILKQIKLDTFIHEIDRKFLVQGKVCAIDIDILVNKLDTTEHLETVADLVHRLRLTEETTNALDSTSHAVVRSYLDQGPELLTELIRILDDRLSYGVFLDSFTTNLLLDTLLKAHNYRLAAKVASFLMLQEDFGNDISRALSLYACYKYAQAPEPFEEPVKPVEEVPKVEEQGAKPAAKGKKKKPEEIRVRVDFVRNEYFDDHFDITNSEHLAGKSLLMIGRQTAGAIGHSAQLIGLCLYQKYEDGWKLAEALTKSNDVHKDAVDLVKAHLAKVTGLENDENFTKFTAAVEKLSQSTQTIADSLEEAIKIAAQEAVGANERKEIDEQEKIYALWCQIRETKLNEELERLRRHERIDKIERITEEIAQKEERLWFFENENKIDLKIEQNEEILRARPEKKSTKAEDEVYIPPEVGRRA